MTELNIDNTKAQMRKGILEFCILLIISKGTTYASDILTQLQTAELIVVEGTLYPLLSRLRNAGLVSYDWEESKLGPPRKYYTLTEQGRTFLTQLTETWNALDKSIGAIQRSVR